MRAATFAEVKLGEKFFYQGPGHNQGFTYMKVSATHARHFDDDYINGHFDYAFEAGMKVAPEAA